MHFSLLNPFHHNHQVDQQEDLAEKHAYRGNKATTTSFLEKDSERTLREALVRLGKEADREQVRIGRSVRRWCDWGRRRIGNA